MLETLRKFMMYNGVSGNEEAAVEGIKKEIAPYVDEVYTDALGNLIAFKKGTAKNAKKLMFDAHIDEIGFMVTFIDDKGFIRVSKIGGINFGAASWYPVVFSNGTKGVFVPTATPNDYCVDIGAKNKKDAEKYVKIGDFCHLESSLTKLKNNRVYGRPIDDRIGCYILFEAAKRMTECKNDTYFVFSVQEEVGVRGSKTAAFAIAPDYGIAIDIGGCGDTIGAAPMAVSLGNGAAIKIKDAMVLCSPKMVDLMTNVAKRDKIKYQYEVLESGGTDTASLQQTGKGSIAGAISIPTRYGHTAVETIDMNDVENAIKLAVGIIGTELE